MTSKGRREKLFLSVRVPERTLFASHASSAALRNGLSDFYDKVGKLNASEIMLILRSLLFMSWLFIHNTHRDVFGARTPKQQVPESNNENSKKLGERQAVLQNRKKNAKRQKPQEKGIRPSLLFTPGKRAMLLKLQPQLNRFSWIQDTDSRFVHMVKLNRSQLTPLANAYSETNYGKF